MLEKFTLKRSPAVIVLKIISSLLTIALIVAFIFAFYLVPEKYDTEADVRNSRAFDAIVDAAETVYKKEIYNYNYDELFVQQSFMPYKITWIYDAT